MTSLANNVREESTTTGTGPVTVTGAVDNGRTINSQYGLNKRFPYFIDDRAGNFEKGTGYLSSPTVLVRETPEDGSAATPVNFPAGTKQVYVAAGADNFPAIRSEYKNTAVAAQYISDALGTGLSTTRAGVANRLWITPFIVLAPCTISELGIDITVLSASAGDMEIGLYDIDYSDNTFTLIDKTGTIDTSTATGSTGYNTSALAGGNLKLSPSRAYFIVVGSDGNATMRGLNHNVGGHPYMPMVNELKAVGAYLTSGWASGLPATITGINDGNTQTSGSYPLPFGVLV